MERINPAEYPVHDLIASRWSPRAFSKRAVEPERLRSLMEAARWAPSSFNEQPWRFIVATSDDPAEHGRLLDCLNPGNQTWAAHAPVLMISVAELLFARNSAPNRHAFHDVGQAVAWMTMEATSLGLYVHQMAGFSPDKAREAYAIPDSAEAVAAIAVGYLGDPSTLPEDLRKREHGPRTRRPIPEFAFAGRWGNTAPWIGSRSRPA